MIGTEVALKGAEACSQQQLLQLRRMTHDGAQGVTHRNAGRGNHAISHQSTTDRGRTGAAAAQRLERAVSGSMRHLLLLDRGDLIQQVAVSRTQVSACLNGNPQITLRFAVPGHDSRISQRLQPTAVGLERVGQRKGAVADTDSFRFVRMFSGKAPQCSETTVEERDPGRHRHVTLELELCHRVQPTRGPGVSDHEHYVTLLHAVRSPTEVVIGLVRIAIVVVYSEEREVEGVARVGEIVGVAPEEPHLQLDREHQSHVGEPAEHIRRVAAAVIQRDDLNANGCTLTRVGRAQSRLDPAKHRSSRPVLCGGIIYPIHRGEHLVAHVFDRD